MTTIIDGKALANELNQHTAERVAALSKQGVTPGLAVIIVGADPASEIYVRNKNKKAEQVGITSHVIKLPETISQTDLMAEVERLNQDPTIHGILVQSPLPKNLNEAEVVAAIAPHKDVDGFHSMNAGQLWNGLKAEYPVACTPKGIMTMLRHYDIPLLGKHAVVVGRSTIVGRPMAGLLLNADTTVTIAHRFSEQLGELTKQADVLVVATGVTHLIKADMVKPGATVIDVGMDRDENGKLTGDVDFDAVQEVAGAITPVPGGVGPMTIATLLEQTVDLTTWSLENGK